MQTDIAIIIFCKVPETGQVKTRLISDKFSPENARDLQIEMIKDTLLMLKLIPFEFQPIFSFYPQNKIEKLEEIVNSMEEELSKQFIRRIMFFPQTKNTTGERFNESFQNAFSLENINSAIILAVDTPHLPVDTLVSAYTHLQDVEHSAVIGPSQQGGFYLFGLNTLLMNSQRIDLSSVFAKTNEFSNLLEISYNNHLEIEVLPFLYDIDQINDLYPLYVELKSIIIAKRINAGEEEEFVPKNTFKFLKTYYQDDF